MPGGGGGLLHAAGPFFLALRFAAGAGAPYAAAP
jgi:hypothetical protein